MAFEQPIEADQIGDFSLLSAFVRAPLWILGGVLGQSIQDESKAAAATDRSESNDDADCSAAESDPADGSSAASTPQQTGSSTSSAPTTAQPQRPQHANSPVHYYYDSKNNIQAKPQQHHRQQARGKSASPPRPLRRSEGTLKRSSKLSWSDENGDSLVEYERQSNHDDSSNGSSDNGSNHAPAGLAHHRHSTSCVGKPTKSVLKKPSYNSTLGGSRRSIPNFGAAGGTAGTTTRYIPNMNNAGRNGNSILAPRRPFAMQSAPSLMQSALTTSTAVDTESPQWGFYTTFTPPTPEMYGYHNHHHQNQNHNYHAGAHHPTSIQNQTIVDDDSPEEQAQEENEAEQSPSSQAAASSSSSSPSPPPKNQQNHVFQGFQATKNDIPPSWTSVPI